MSIRKIVRTKINFKDVLIPTGNRILIFTATFFLDKKSSQKSQDGGILSTRKAGAGPVRRRPARIEQLKFSLSNYVLGFKEYVQLSGYTYCYISDFDHSVACFWKS